MAMLEVKDINVYYGLIHALRDVSFEVNEGEVVALIGANGAGKTTTLRTITGLLPSKGGTVTFEGSRPVIVCSVVVLPTPFAPMSATTSPSFTSRETSRSA